MIRTIHMNSNLRRWHLLARKALINAGHPDFKPESSAKWVDISRSWKGNVLVQIEHDTMKNVTPEMVCWWFQNQARTTTWNGIDFNGPEIPLYHLWHHRDHIAVTPLTNRKDQTINYGFLEGAVSTMRQTGTASLNFAVILPVFIMISTFRIFVVFYWLLVL